MADLMIDQLAQGDLRSGNLEVRLAESSAEVDAAQALRYRVFYTEMAARPSPEMAARRRDFDSFDRVCDHLLVIEDGTIARRDVTVGDNWGGLVQVEGVAAGEQVVTAPLEGLEPGEAVELVEF